MTKKSPDYRAGLEAAAGICKNVASELLDKVDGWDEYAAAWRCVSEIQAAIEQSQPQDFGCDWAVQIAAQANWNKEINDVCSIEWSEKDGGILYTHADNQIMGSDISYVWNPLIEDSDAFKLMVKLQLDNMSDITDESGNPMVSIIYPLDNDYFSVEEPIGKDPYAATRRAITRAAAKIAAAPAPEAKP